MILILLTNISIMSCNTSKEIRSDQEINPTSTADTLKITETRHPESTPEVEITATMSEPDQLKPGDLYDGIEPINQRITFWHPFTGNEEISLQEIIKVFNDSNEWGITIVTEYQGVFSDLHEKILAAMNTQDIPNIVLSNGSQAGTYQLGDVLINLNTLVEHDIWGLESSEKSRIFPGFYQRGIFDLFGGARLSYPLFGNMNVLYYNADWLAELGFSDPPASPEAFQQAACAAIGQPFSGATIIGRLGYGVIPDPSSFVDWSFAFGGKQFDQGKNQYSIDNFANVAAMTYLQNLLNSGCATAYNSHQDVMTDFSRGVLLFSIDSTDKIPTYRSNIQAEANFNWRISPIPHTTNNPATNVTAVNASITKTTPEEQLAAWLFLKYFTSAEVQASWVQTTNALSIRRDTASYLEDYFLNSPAYQMTFELLNDSVSEPAVPKYDQVRGKYSDALQAIFDGANVDNILAELTSEANLILSEQLVLLPETPDAWAEVDPNGQIIRLWHQHSGERQATLEEIINEFNITNKWGITLIPEKRESYGDIFTNLIPIIGTSEAPNLVTAYQHHAAAYYLAEGLINLDSLVDSPTWGINSPERDDFFPGIYSQDVFSIFDEVRLGYPVQRSTDVLYYNEDWLAELGFNSPPATTEEFQQIACAVTSPFEASSLETGIGYQFYVDSTRFSSWVFAFGGDIYNDDTNKFIYNDQTITNTIKFLLDLIETGCATAEAGRDMIQTAFSEGQTLFMVDSSIYISTVEKIVKDNADFEWSVAPMPSSGGIPIQNVFGASMSIPFSTTEAELAAWLFLKFFTTPEIQARWAQGSNYLPVRISAADYLGTYLSDHPKTQIAFELLHHGVTEPSVPGYDFVGQEVELALEAILEGGDVNTILGSLQETANQVLTLHMER